MFTEYIYQDWEEAKDKEALIPKIVNAYKGSCDFEDALKASLYFDGENTEIMKKTVMTLDAVKGEDGKTVARDLEIIGNRVSSNFFSRFVVQQNQFLLGNGVTLTDNAQKDKLGKAFDTTLQQIGENALVQGVCYGFWNHDHLEMIQAAADGVSGFAPLLDELTGTLKAGIQFWQTNAERPVYYRVFEESGITEYKQESDVLTETAKKRGYVQTVRSDALGKEMVSEANYSALPIIPMYANPGKRSELKASIKTKIDLYDRILSDFGDNLDRTNDIYWAINNFGGTADDVIAMLAEINRIKATYTEASASGQSTAVPHTIEVPYEARKVALELLKKALYQDYMALDMDELTGGSLTNVAIKAAMANLELKADRYEWQAFAFVQQVLYLLGIETEEIMFKRRGIVNDSEVIQDIYAMRGDLSVAYALKLNPYVAADDIPQILKDRDAEADKERGYPSAVETGYRGRRQAHAGG